MTAAPHSPLVEKVARAIFAKRNGKWDYARWCSDPRIAEAYRADAQSVLEACHAEEMRAVLQCLLAAIGRLPVRIMTGELTEAVLSADAVLKALKTANPASHP